MRIHRPHLFERNHDTDGRGEDAGDGDGDGDAPLPGYEQMSQKELVAELHHHSQAELAEIEHYERAHGSRTRVLNKLHYLRQSEPLPSYDTLSPEEIAAALEKADLATIDHVRAYERKFRDRPGVLDAISAIRPRVAEMEAPREPATYRHTSYGPSVSAAAASSPGPGELAANKALVTSLYAEAINDRNLDAVDRLLSEEFIHNGRPRPRSEQKAELGKLLEGFADLATEIELILAEGDLVAVHQRWTGTHGGSVAGVDHGEQVEFTSTAVIRIRDGRIAEAWDEVDIEGLADLYTKTG